MEECRKNKYAAAYLITNAFEHLDGLEATIKTAREKNVEGSHNLEELIRGLENAKNTLSYIRENLCELDELLEEPFCCCGDV